jgi:hypothetical protein
MWYQFASHELTSLRSQWLFMVKSPYRHWFMERVYEAWPVRTKLRPLSYRLNSLPYPTTNYPGKITSRSAASLIPNRELVPYSIPSYERVITALVDCGQKKAPTCRLRGGSPIRYTTTMPVGTPHGLAKGLRHPGWRPITQALVVLAHKPTQFLSTQ